MSGETGVIKSPNYPARYVGNENCVWLIEVPDGENVTLEFTDFDLENRRDFVIVRQAFRMS